MLKEEPGTWLVLNKHLFRIRLCLPLRHLQPGRRGKKSHTEFMTKARKSRDSVEGQQKEKGRGKALGRRKGPTLVWDSDMDELQHLKLGRKGKPGRGWQRHTRVAMGQDQPTQPEVSTVNGETVPMDLANQHTFISPQGQRAAS